MPPDQTIQVESFDPMPYRGNESGRRPHRRADRHRRLDRRDGQAARHPDRGRPVRDGRRRHRLVRHGRLPAHRGRADRRQMRVAAGSTGPGRPTSTSPSVSQIPRRAPPLRLRRRCPTTSGASRATRSARRGPSKTLAPLWNVLTEPILTDYFTPAGRPGLRDAGARGRPHRLPGAWSSRARCAWSGAATDGGYFTILTPPHGTSPTKRVAYRSTFRAHRCRLSRAEVPARPAGVPTEARGLRPGRQRLRAPRARLRGAAAPTRARCSSAAAASWPRACCSASSTTATSHGAQTQIIHLFRTYVTGRHGPNIFMRRKGGDGWAYQGFNWPKSAWGGQTEGAARAARGRRPQGALRPARRHQHAAPQALAAAARPRPEARAGTAPSWAR